MTKNNHVGGQRREAAKQKIKKKIEILKRYAADTAGIPEGAFVPKDLAAFRTWEDKNLGLEKIGSPNTMDRPYNKESKKRALNLIEKLAKKKARKDQRGKTIDSLRATVKSYKRSEREFANQIHATRHELGKSQQNERRLQARVDYLTNENGEIRRQLMSITGLRSA